MSRRGLIRAAFGVGLAGGTLTLPEVGCAPSLTHAAPPALAAADERLAAGRDAALDVLRHLLSVSDGYTVHHAGDRYRNPWIRDSFAWGATPVYGLSELDPYVGSELQFWLAHQYPSGQWVTDPQSGYWDETAMLIAATLDAYRITGDRALLTTHLRRLENGWLWLYGYRREDSAAPHLLWAELNRQTQSPPVATDWADQIARGNWATGLNITWYSATRALATAERIAGRADHGRFFDDFAEAIRREINASLWRVSAPRAIRAPALPPVGHYVGWAPGNDYYELDTNLLAIVAEVADESRARTILDTVEARWGEVFGSEYGPPAAKVVWGDYATEDWATIQTSTSPGAYHMAFWVNVGALAAVAYHRLGRAERVRSLLLGMANALAEARGGTGVREWYAFDGTAHGSEQYGWAARGYLWALYRAYVGVDSDRADALGRNLRVAPMFGGVVADIVHLGKRLRLETHGPDIGRYSYARVGGQRLTGPVIPEAALRDGDTIDLYLE